jgi:hypothetical protein
MSRDFLTLTQAALELPGRPHISTLHRWRLTGIKGIKLNTVRVCGKRMVDRLSLQEFIDSVTAAADGAHPQAETPVQHQRAIERAEKRADELGL